MSETSLLVMVKFKMVVGGKTFDAHLQILDKLRSSTQQLNLVESQNSEDCQMAFVFCPVVSRVGTDVEAAMKLVMGKTMSFSRLLHWVWESYFYLTFFVFLHFKICDTFFYFLRFCFSINTLSNVFPNIIIFIIFASNTFALHDETTMNFVSLTENLCMIISLVLIYSLSLVLHRWCACHSGFDAPRSWSKACYYDGNLGIQL